MTLDDVQTPALILNVDALERNLARMASECAAAGIALRPHTKTHKSPWVSAKQIRLGAAGVCTAKLGEAEVMVKAGIPNVHLTTELTPSNMDRALDIAALAELSVVADAFEMVDLLSAKARDRGLTLTVLADVNVGQNRTGVEPGEPVLQLARRILDAPALRFGGLQGYEGHCQHIRDRAERRGRAFEAYARLAETKALLIDHEIPVPVVTTAGTGTYAAAIEHGTATEVQPGSYTVMDSDYAAVQGLPFEHALFVLTSVVSNQRAGLAIIDAGHKTVSTDAGAPAVKDFPEAKYQAAGDEHGKIAGLPARRTPGDRIWLIPSHCDTTINLYNRYVLVRDDGRCLGTLTIDARGQSA